MSLKEQSKKLKEEIYRLKKNAALPKLSTPHHRELHDILYGRKHPLPVSKLNNLILENSYDQDDIIQTELSDSTEMFEKEYSRIIHKQYKNATKTEIKHIKEMDNVPAGYVVKLHIKPKDEDSEALDKTIKINKKAEDKENFMLRKNMLAMAKTFKKNYSNKVENKSTNNYAKENFAETCSMIYNQRKDISNCKIKDLITQTRTKTKV